MRSPSRASQQGRAHRKGTPWFGGSAETGKIVFVWKAKVPGLHEEMLRDAKLETP